ncbi:DMT family transporter [candidate division KSB1 bacterium]|nr:DMT family transporter [candidate division KSB1 bacterium]
MNANPRPLTIVLMLTLGLLSVSVASIFIKMCDAPSLVIAAWRLTIASTFYVIFTRIKVGPIWSYLQPAQKKIAVISGLFLTLHFATWITSLKYTSVASSVVLVQSAPMFVAIGSAVFLREKPNLMMVVGIIITLIGSVLINIDGFTGDKNSLLGNLLAIGGAIGAAGYMLAGRRLRAHIDTFRYVTIVYLIAAVLLLMMAIGSGNSLIGYSSATYLLFIAIAVFPQIIGHTVINWSLKIFSATTVSIIILAEPILASFLAFLILAERFSTMQAIGASIILVGVVIVLVGESKQASV